MTQTAPRRAFAAAAAVALAALVSPAHAAPDIGVAAAVNPQAIGKPAGGSERTIVLGEKLTFNERVETSEGGLVQVLLLDGSTFTVGPNSDLVIDEFVYNPATGNGKLVASFSKGVMRFIGGKLSKNEGGVKVRTPVGLMGIRGGVADVKVGDGTGFFSMIFGEELSLLGPDGKLQRVLEAGFAIDVSHGISGPIEIRQVTDGEARLFISQLSGKAGTSGGATQTPTSQTVQNSGVSSQGSNSDPDATGPGKRADAVQSEEAANLFRNNLAKNTIIARKDMRVLSTGASYTVATSGNTTETIVPTGTGVVGANAGTDPTGGDQQANFAINMLLEGTAQLEGGAITIPYPITEGTYVVAGVPSPFGTLTGVVDFGPNLDFTFYRLFVDGDLAKPVYIIGGNPTPEDKLTGTGDVQRYSLGEDIVQQIAIPFVTAGSAGTDTAGASVSDLFLVRPDATRFDAAPDVDPLTPTPVALQASLQVAGSQQNQVSTLVLAVGPTGGTIERLGGTRQLAGEGATAFSGGIGIIEGPDGAQMFGPEGERFVIGPDLDNGRPFIDTPDTGGAVSLADLVSATIHVAMFGSQTQLATLDRTPGTLTGFAAGMVEKIGEPGSATPYRSTSTGDLVMEFDPDNNTLGGELVVRDVANLDPDLESIQAAFGDGIGGNDGNDGPSAMVDDDIFAAGPNAEAARTILTEQGGGPTTTAADAATGTYVVSSKLVGDVLPDKIVGGVPETKTPCTCEYMKWGYWGTKPKFDDATAPVDANVHLGTWVAGNVAQEVDLPTIGSASYEGHAVGNVNNAGNQYLASGDLNLEWDFASRNGTMNINNFDGLNVSGAMTGSNLGTPTTDPNAFGGGLSGGIANPDIVGSASGAFTTPFEGVNPTGVMGAFDLNNGTDYSAAGTFMGNITGSSP